MNHRTALWTIVLFSSVAAAYGRSPGNISQATLGESGQLTDEVSTKQLRGILAEKSAVVLDARPFREFSISHIPGALPNARDLPRSGVLEGKDVGKVKRAKDDGRLPMGDHNTRLIVIGRHVAEAQYVATALSREASHNVAYFRAGFEDARCSETVSPEHGLTWLWT
jgi:rhodanese-related sulfurtransferase